MKDYVNMDGINDISAAM